MDAILLPLLLDIPQVVCFYYLCECSTTSTVPARVARAVTLACVPIFINESVVSSPKVHFLFSLASRGGKSSIK